MVTQNEVISVIYALSTTEMVCTVLLALCANIGVTEIATEARKDITNRFRTRIQAVLSCETSKMAPQRQNMPKKRVF